MTEKEAMGPISYLIVEFPGSKMTGEGFPILVDLVDKGVIRISISGSSPGTSTVRYGRWSWQTLTLTAGSTWPCSTVFPQAWLTKVTLLTPLRSSSPARPPGSLYSRTAGPHPSSPPCGAARQPSWRPVTSPTTRWCRRSTRRSRRAPEKRRQRSCPDFYEAWPARPLWPVRPPLCPTVFPPAGQPLVDAGGGLLL